jgi:hypothetical protein
MKSKFGGIRVPHCLFSCVFFHGILWVTVTISKGNSVNNTKFTESRKSTLTPPNT